MIPDFPTTPVPWLTHEERILAQRRMVEDFSSIKPQETQKSGLEEAFSDWTVWWLAIARSMATVGESFANFFPTLAATIGYDPSVTLLICAPPWIFAMATAYCVSQFVIRLIPFINSSLKPFSDTQMLLGPFLAHCCSTLWWYLGFWPRDYDDEPCCPLLVSVCRKVTFLSCVCLIYVVDFSWLKLMSHTSSSSPG